MKQTTILNAQVIIQQVDAENRAIVIQEVIAPGVPGDTTTIILPNAGAEEIGKKLAAPSIHRPGPGDFPSMN